MILRGDSMAMLTVRNLPDEVHRLSGYARLNMGKVQRRRLGKFWPMRLNRRHGF